MLPAPTTSGTRSGFAVYTPNLGGSLKSRTRLTCSTVSLDWPSCPCLRRAAIPLALLRPSQRRGLSRPPPESILSPSPPEQGKKGRNSPLAPRPEFIHPPPTS